MEKARITIAITKEVPTNGKSLDQLIDEADNSFYDFLFTGKREDMIAEITGELVDA